MRGAAIAKGLDFGCAGWEPVTAMGLLDCCCTFCDCPVSACRILDWVSSPKTRTLYNVEKSLHAC